MDKLVFTPLEACKALSIGRTKLYQLLNSGQIKALALGGRTVIQRAEIERFVGSLPQIPLQSELKHTQTELAEK